MKPILRGLCLLLLAGGCLIFAFPTGAQSTNQSVAKVEIDGAITPVMALYVDRGIDDAVERGDAAVMLEIDTPGGLSSAMDDIISDILHSPIPVIAYVAPEGARAASAGMYITYAAHVAAMAPVTNIGSATPVQLSGDDDGEESAMDRKVINDAVARVRELADLRGRNADWAEDAVRDAVNVGAQQAVDLNVVDFIASDYDELFAKADGREVRVESGMVTVETAGATLHDIDMSLFERILQIIVNPNVAFILLSLGTLGLVFELSSPGAIFPGVAGALMMIVGFYALGTLESNAAGFILIALAFALFVLEVFVVSHGILAVGGIIAFILGGLLLSNTRNPEVLQISRWVIFTVAILIGLFFIFVVGSVIKIRGKAPVSGDTSLIGATGVARTDLDPQGTIFLHGELWQAAVEDEPVILKGEQVKVQAREGIKLRVTRVVEEQELGEDVTAAEETDSAEASPAPGAQARGYEPQ